ncbi:MAG: 3D domain-containing protein [Bacilli bacterium]|jgi:3D (Asp-Asp-Asp) domain-containing protein
MKKTIPLWIKMVYVFTVIVAFNMFLPIGIKQKVTIDNNDMLVNNVSYNAVPSDLISEKVIYTFTGQLTGYGPDCKGCSGITASGYDVSGGTIYYSDKMYGDVRIVASDHKYKLGTIVRITLPNIYDYPIIAIVLDRGSAIKGDKFDLLFTSEDSTSSIGVQRDVKYEVLRIGWKDC